MLIVYWSEFSGFQSCMPGLCNHTHWKIIQSCITHIKVTSTAYLMTTSYSSILDPKDLLERMPPFPTMTHLLQLKLWRAKRGWEARKSNLADIWCLSIYKTAFLLKLTFFRDLFPNFITFVQFFFLFKHGIYIVLKLHNEQTNRNDPKYLESLYNKS